MITALKRSYILIIAGFTIFSGCLKDNITTSPEFQLNGSGKLLFYLEESGDYINNDDMPSLVSADEVYSNLQSCLVIDIRPHEEYVSGHIQNAVNKQHSELLDYLKSINTAQYYKIVIVSMNGQASAFYTCLLRLYGFDNIFSMSYGMAAWNNNFSSEWLNSLHQDDNLLRNFNLELVSKPGFTPLPAVNLTGSSLSEQVKNRISSVMEIDYADNFTGSEGSATIDFSYLADRMDQYYIVCYNMGLLYRHLILGIVHPPGAVLYTPPPSSSDLSSTTNLQTLPSDRKIAFYSTDGQLSAFAAAYLQVLGYNAKSVLFGANNMFYQILLGAEGLNAEAFTPDKINSYPYVTGN